jgi:hypothetical protein
MSTARDFIPIRLRHVDARYGRKIIREIRASEKARGVVTKRGRFIWAGTAAEAALCHAFSGCPAHSYQAQLADTLRYDLKLGTPGGGMRCEVKTRVAESGWIHPERFDWISVPMHEDREPIKAEADIIIFCWWSADTPRVLWIVGKLPGVTSFQRVATFYKEGELLPRGGYVRGHGVYQVEVSQLDPVPRGLFKERKDV